MPKRTAAIFVHFRNADMSFADEWLVLPDDDEYKITFERAPAHEKMFAPFDLNRGQYDFYCIAMTADECGEAAALLLRIRAAKNNSVIKPQPERGEALSSFQLLIIRMKDKGLTYRQIADAIPCTVACLKKQFQRLGKHFGVRGFHAVINSARRQTAF